MHGGMAVGINMGVAVRMRSHTQIYTYNHANMNGRTIHTAHCITPWLTSLDIVSSAWRCITPRVLPLYRRCACSGAHLAVGDVTVRMYHFRVNHSAPEMFFSFFNLLYVC